MKKFIYVRILNFMKKKVTEKIRALHVFISTVGTPVYVKKLIELIIMETISKFRFHILISCSNNNNIHEYIIITTICKDAHNFNLKSCTFVCKFKIKSTK